MTEFSRIVYNFNDRFSLNDTTTDSTKYALTGVTNITDTAVINTEDDKPEEAGVIDYGAKLGKGSMGFPITLYASSLTNMNSLIETLKSAFNPDLLELDSTYGESTSYMGYHPMLWTETVGGVSRDVKAFVKPEEIPQVLSDPMAGLIRRSFLKLKVADPRKYAQTQSTLSGAGTANNAGTYTTPVIITVTASGSTSTSLTIGNSTTSESIVVSTALSAGQVLVINTGTHSVTLDGTEKRSMLSGTSTWFFLRPGNNTLTVSNGSNATVSFAWNSAWSL